MREELIRGLLEVASDRARTVLVSSHDIDEVERLADWVGYLDRGRLRFAEPVSSLLERFKLVEVVAPADRDAGHAGEIRLDRAGSGGSYAALRRYAARRT